LLTFQSSFVFFSSNLFTCQLVYSST